MSYEVQPVAWVNSGLSDDRAREDVLNMQAPQSSNWQHDVKGRVGCQGSGDPARVLLDSHVLPATRLASQRVVG